MHWFERLHALHRCWRFRLRSERDSIAYLRSQSLTGTTVLDIGANHGAYAYWLSKQVGPTGRVLAFEPQPEMVQYIEGMKRSFGMGNVVVENLGLSDRAGKLLLARRHVGDGGGTLMAAGVETLAGTPEEEHSIRVPVDRLDTRLAAHGNPSISYIKCDVEGHELSVFRGGVEMLQRDRPTLHFECHHDQAVAGELFAFLEAMGYDGFFLDGKEPRHYSAFAEVPYRKGDTHRNYFFSHEATLRRAA